MNALLIDIPSRLTWESVLLVVDKFGAQGAENAQIAELLGAERNRCSGLTLVMWEAGAIARVRVHGSGATLYRYVSARYADKGGAYKPAKQQQAW